MTRALALATLAALLCAGSAAAATPKEAFDAIKRVEGSFPVPEPRARGTIGTFDIAAGTFDGKRTIVRYDAARKPPRTEIVPQLRINGVHATVVFRFTNPTGRTVTVDVNGRTRTVTRQRSAAFDIGRERRVEWRITSNGRTIADRARISRPRMVGAGAFVIQALPVAVVYEPPQPADPDLRNAAAYTQGTSIGTRITTALSRGTSTTSTSAAPGYADSESLREKAGMLASGFAKVSGHKAIAAGLSAFAGAVGSAERTEENVEIAVRERALEVRLTETRACSTGARLGPGRGDVIAYLENVRVAWIDDGTQTTLTVLGADYLGCKSVRTLQAALGTPLDPRRAEATCFSMSRPGALGGPAQPRPCSNGMSAQTVRALLAQDPFVAGGPAATLPPDRFELRTPGIVADADAPQEYRYEVLVSSDDTQAQTTSTVTTDRTSAGLLGFAGIGPDSTSNLTTTVTARSAASFREERSVATTLLIEGPPPGTDRLDVYYDRVYGTFALKAG